MGEIKGREMVPGFGGVVAFLAVEMGVIGLGK